MEELDKIGTDSPPSSSISPQSPHDDRRDDSHDKGRDSRKADITAVVTTGGTESVTPEMSKGATPVQTSSMTTGMTFPLLGVGKHGIFSEIGGQRKKILHILLILKNQATDGQIIINQERLAEATGIPYGTFRNEMRVLKKMNFFTTRSKSGHHRGTILKYNSSLCDKYVQANSVEMTTGVTQRVTPSMTTGVADNRRDSGQVTSKEDGQKENLSVKTEAGKGLEAKLRALSDQDIAFFWPSLAKAGFGNDQIRQILDRLTQLGKAPDKVASALDHAEWELTHGEMKDKSGTRIQSPLGYLFNSLARTGYYRRPPDYISSEEQAERDRQAEAAALAKARKARQEAEAEAAQAQAKAEEDAEFAAWLAGLAPDELAEIDNAPRRMGPPEQWRRHKWREITGKNDHSNAGGEPTK